jgi:putative glycosyltransferase (TIGR04348 family)
MKIAIITPAPRTARTGNRHTAARWALMLRRAGHRVEVSTQWNHGAADMMIALHARRSHPAIAAYARAFPARPLVVVLTGTDVYRDIHFDGDAQRSLALATRLVVLQDAAIDELAPALREKTRVIRQSARALSRRARGTDDFEVLVSGHLREEKDPFCAARALAHLPPESAIRVSQIGAALTATMAETAHEFMAREPRYRWLGELTHARALRLLGRAALLVVSSRMEGGANVISEALAAGVPVIGSRIPGNIGMLGSDYPGYYPLSDAVALAGLLRRAELEPVYYAALEHACAARAPLFTPACEEAGLAALIAELQPSQAVRFAPGAGAEPGAA